MATALSTAYARSLSCWWVSGADDGKRRVAVTVLGTHCHKPGNRTSLKKQPEGGGQPRASFNWKACLRSMTRAASGRWVRPKAPRPEAPTAAQDASVCADASQRSLVLIPTSILPQPQPGCKCCETHSGLSIRGATRSPRCPQQGHMSTSNSQQREDGAHGGPVRAAQSHRLPGAAPAASPALQLWVLRTVPLLGESDVLTHSRSEMQRRQAPHAWPHVCARLACVRTALWLRALLGGGCCQERMRLLSRAGHLELEQPVLLQGRFLAAPQASPTCLFIRYLPLVTDEPAVRGSSCRIG